MNFSFSDAPGPGGTDGDRALTFQQLVVISGTPPLSPAWTANRMVHLSEPTRTGPCHALTA
jgi:hypothetical protein